MLLQNTLRSRQRDLLLWLRYYSIRSTRCSSWRYWT